MEINTRREKDIVIVTVKGRMGEVSAPEFEEKMNELIDKGETKFLVDLEGLEYISSAGLRGLLAAAKTLKEKDGQIFLSGLMGAVREVFEISQFISIFQIFETVDSALSRM
jgi:anti-anti-sigma factor